MPRAGMPDTMPVTARIELRLRELNQLFNSMDPSPFYDKDLDANAEEFIVGWARELPQDRPFEIVVHLTEPLRSDPSLEKATTSVREALQHYFAELADQQRRQFSELMRMGRVSLVLGLTFLAACFAVSNLIGGGVADPGPMRSIFRESLIIVGWVALWRPLEIFLYDWWPLVRNRRLYQRLSTADVTVQCGV